MENTTRIPDEGADREQFWTAHVEAWQQSELSQREYARQHGLPIARFTYWKNKLYPAERSAEFVELKVNAAAPVRIYHRSGTVIECMPGTEVRWLQALLGMADAS